MKARYLKLIICLLFGALLQQTREVNAAPTSVPPWPATVAVGMFRLDPLTGESTEIPCTYGDANYGCTAFCNDILHCDQSHPEATYPYSSSVAAIPIESYYLLNVISQEMDPSAYDMPAALESQAIASRSYAGWFINNAPDDLDNSSARQVFIPYRFDSLNPEEAPLELGTAAPCLSATLNGLQALVCDAVASGSYIARSDVDLPTFAEFSSDAYLRTLSNEDDRDGDGQRDFVYLTGVDDPISYDPLIADHVADAGAHQRGLSQGGLNRWLYGNSSKYGTGDPWSVQWEHVEYILTHYYTQIHLHDAAGERLTPNYRWVPLAIDWHTSGNIIPDFIYRERYSITVAIQNTGVYTWIDSGQFALHALWMTPASEELAAPQAVVAETNLFRITQPVTPGGSLSATFTLRPPWPSSDSADYVLRFTMRQEEDDWVDFGDLEAGLPWPGYDVAVSVTRPAAGPLVLPLIVSGIDDEPPPSLSLSREYLTIVRLSVSSIL